MRRSRSTRSRVLKLDTKYSSISGCARRHSSLQIPDKGLAAWPVSPVQYSPLPKTPASANCNRLQRSPTLRRPAMVPPNDVETDNFLNLFPTGPPAPKSAKRRRPRWQIKRRREREPTVPARREPEMPQCAGGLAQRRGWDSNPRAPLPRPTVFETAPFNHSGTPPWVADSRGRRGYSALGSSKSAWPRVPRLPASPSRRSRSAASSRICTAFIRAAS